MPPLPRATCPVCRCTVALRRGDLIREHADHRHELYGVGGAVFAGRVPKCPASGLTVAEASDEFEIPTCRICGCTDDAACEEGCWWVPDPAGRGDLCSSCLAVAEAKGAVK